MKKIIVSIFFLSISFGIIAQSYIVQIKLINKNEWGYIDINENPIGTDYYQRCFPFTENGYAIVIEEKQLFFINKFGEKLETEIQNFRLIQFAGIFGEIQGYHNGLVAVMEDNKWGYLDISGHIFIPLKYDKVSIFNGGFAVAKLKNDFFVLNNSGEENKIISNNIVSIKRFSEGLAPYSNKDKLFGFIDTNGRVVIEAKFRSVGFFSNGIAWAKTTDNIIGYINTEGIWLIQPQFQTAKDFDKISGLARVKQNNRWNYVNISGNIRHMSDTELWGDFYDGLAKGRKGGLIGFYDNTGYWVINPKFEAVRDFHNGYAAAKKSGKWGLINNIGDWVIQPKYAVIRDIERID